MSIITQRVPYYAMVSMRAKPEMNPWVNTDTKNKSSVGAALLVPANVIPQPKLTYGSAALAGLNKSV